MSNHPSRGRDARCRNPRPEEIRAAREKARLTQSEAAELVCASLVAWQQWEYGERRMHPAFWHLFRIEVARLR